MEQASLNSYFESYEDLEVHRVMLSDQARTEAYRNAIFANKDIFRDKVVMDVGAGTGILSLFCAQVNARKVYAVEASNIANLTKQVVEDNNFSHIIDVLKCPVEDVVLPNDRKVDIIVSEWMGFYLLHEGMLDSVLVARDKHLKPEGKLFPSVVNLYACPCSLSEMYQFWENVYGMNMSVFAKEIQKTKTKRPEVMQLRSEDMLSKPVRIFEMNLSSVTLQELDEFSHKFVTPACRSGTYQGLCVWFSCVFPISHDSSIILSTSPSDPPTHWKQTVIVLPDVFSVDEGEPIACELNLSRSSENHRHYNIQFSTLDPEKETHSIPCDCYMTKCIVTRTFLECQEEKIDAGTAGGNGNK